MKMSSNLKLQTKTITKLLHSPTISLKHILQIHTQLLVKSQNKFFPVGFSNSLISSYASSSSPKVAFTFFVNSYVQPSNANTFTFQSLLKSSSKCRSIYQTTVLHSLIYKLGFITCTQIQNGLLKCYLACSKLNDARSLFDQMPLKDIVSYNTMISGYFEFGNVELANSLFDCIPIPNIVTWTTMITGFCNNGEILLGREYFDKMHQRDLVSWNAMISGYVHNQKPIQALKLFSQMQSEKLKPNRVTVVSILSACASLGALYTGKWIHVYVNKNKFRLDAFLGSALIDMYAKCGTIEFALDVFGRLREKNVCAWNSMINGLASNGYAKKALDLFSKMRFQKVVPDELTFVGVLMACSHGGFLEEGKKHFFHTMKKYNICLILEHYACIVDLLCRCGLLDEAEDIVSKMQMKPDVIIWRALLGGCKLHKNVELAEKIVSKMTSHESGDYVLLSNLYASVGRWKEVERMRRIIKDKGIAKTPGCSSIEINNTIHEFISNDKSHPRYNEIISKLNELGKMMKKEGYRVETLEVSYDIEEEEKEHALEYHSEKLAIAFGIMSTDPETTLRIVKNLRVCVDCHNVTRLLSKICKREIIVRDRLRFHHFKDGVCSCNNFW